MSSLLPEFKTEECEALGIWPKAVFICLFYMFAYIFCLYYTLLISQRLCRLPAIAIYNATRKYTNSMINKKAGSEEISMRKRSLDHESG